MPNEVTRVLQAPPSRARNDAETAFVWAAAAVGVAILWAYAWPPGMDWAHQTSLVDILVRYARGEAAIRAHFVPVLQPVGYHGFFAAATPLAFVFDAKTASLLVMSAVLLAHVGASLWAARRVGGPPILGVVGVIGFFGGHFTWGFVVTLFATPFVYVVLALLLQGAERGEAGAPRERVWLGVAATFFAIYSHVVFAPNLLVAAATAGVLHPRRRRPVALAVFATACACLLPPLLLRLRAATTSTTPSDWACTSWWRGLTRFVDVAQAVDKSSAFVGYLVLMAVLALCALTPQRGQPGLAERCSVALTLASTVAFIWVIPVDSSGPLGSSFLLNLRGMALFPFFGLLLAARSRLWHAARLRSLASAALVVAVSLTLHGTWRLTQTYNREVADWVAQAEQLPHGSRLASISLGMGVAQAWPPILQNMATTAFPGRLSWQNGLFLGGHLPVRGRVENEGQHLEDTARRVVGALAAPDGGEDDVRALWQLTDFLFVQHAPLSALRAAPTGARLLAEGLHWRLYGPPAR